MKPFTTITWLILGFFANSSAWAQTMAWPPSKLLAVGVQVQVTNQHHRWVAKITGKNAGGDWSGDAITDGIGNATFLAYLEETDGAYYFQMGIPNNNAIHYEYCSFGPNDVAEAENGVVTGIALVNDGPDSPAVFDGACTATIITSSQSNPNPAANLDWSPNSKLGAGMKVQVEGRQLWNTSITGKDKDGDWTGTVTGADGKTATLYTYVQKDDSFVFQLAYIDQGGASEFCMLERSGAQAGGVYRGKRFFSASKGAKAETDGECRVSLITTPPQPTGMFAIKTQLGSGGTLQLELRQGWSVTIGGKDNDGDWTGKALGADGTNGTMFSFEQNDGSFVLQIVYSSHGTIGSEFCKITELGNGVFNGKRFYKPSKDATIQADGDCRITLGHGQAVVNGNTANMFVSNHGLLVHPVVGISSENNLISTAKYGLSTVPAGLNSVAEIAARDTFALALKTDGTIVGLGNQNSSAPNNILLP